MMGRAMRNVPLFLAAALAMFAMVALGLALVWRAADQAELAEGRKANCTAIEALKAHVREEASESYASLDRTLRVLGIAKTPEIVEIARSNRDTTLVRFAEANC